ncbi:MAG: DNA polymerase III subunit alpha [Ignavibacteriales bacterium]
MWDKGTVLLSHNSSAALAMFIHLHCHSNFSFLDGGSRIEALVDQAAELGMPALALTDHDNLCGAVKFHARARKLGIKPIQGVEITLYNGHHLTLLARGPEGYKNLCRMLTRAHLENPRRQPRVTPANLKDNAAHIIALSGCRRGEIAHHILTRRYAEAWTAATKFCDIWGKDNFYLEMQDNYIPGTRQLNAGLVELAGRLGLKTAASNNVHYAGPDDFRAHDILTCIRTLTKVYEVHPERPLNAENYLKSSQAMEKVFRDYPQAIENTWRIAEECQVALNLDTPHFPAFDLPPGQEAGNLLRHAVYEGAVRKYGQIREIVGQRLEHELSIINTLGYNDYFLVVWDIANYARREGIRFAGRGSAADSLVAYCLNITEVDSLERGLLFERFMSLERGEKPDIDIDFDSRFRDKVAGYVYRKYGDDKVASVCTYNTFLGRSAIREVGKALGLPEEELGHMAKKLPWGIQADRIKQIAVELPELRQSGLQHEKFELLLDLCEKIAGFPRFLGTHLGGIVISREPMHELTPLQEAAKGLVITQFDKDDIEDLGLIKLDLLSLRTLSAVEDAAAHIVREKPDFSYEAIPLDDPSTYEMINRGETIGVFQLESPAQRALQSRLAASGIEDIVASVAIIRPGPIKGNMVEPYIARRQEKEPVTYLHPKLEPILSKTYGVILFQEQVIEVATAIANFTPGEADNLRRVMTHARSHQAMEEIGDLFVDKACKNGISKDLAREIFACMAGYASYGFCEGHAAAFATTSFKTAYLTNHYPAQFYAAILSNYPMGYYPPHIICNEARRRGIKIKPPHINIGGDQFEVDHEGAIRVPLSSLKGLSRAGLASIIENRPFGSLEELVLKTRLDRGELEGLIKCGALDELDSNRRRLLALLRGCLQYKRDNNLGEAGRLFTGSDKAVFNIPDFSEEEKLGLEFKLLGIEVTRHYMAGCRAYLQQHGFKSSQELPLLKANSHVKMAGILFRPHRPPTRSGRITVFMSLEDEFGLTDVTVFEDVYRVYGAVIYSSQAVPLIVEGLLQKRGNGVSIIARKVGRLAI